ncbi:MAG: hypothetical protein ACTHLO_19950 [Pseudolabrys sp.]
MTGVHESGRGRTARDCRAETADDIENEFLGLWMDIARLREKVLTLVTSAVPASQGPQQSQP